MLVIIFICINKNAFSGLPQRRHGFTLRNDPIKILWKFFYEKVVDGVECEGILQKKE